MKLDKTAVLVGAFFVSLSVSISHTHAGEVERSSDKIFEKIKAHQKKIKLDERVKVDPQSREYSIVEELGLPKGTWHKIGKIEKAGKDEKPPEITALSRIVDTRSISRENRKLIAEPVPAKDNMAVYDTVTNEVYEVNFSKKESDELRKVLEMYSLAEGTAGENDGEADEEDFLPKAWSNGTDNRYPKGIHENGSGGTFARLGQLDSSCSATLVGTPDTDYYVITAAHCLFATGSGDWTDPDFIPRRDACRDKSGSWISGCDTRPYGTWNGGRWMTYQYFLDNCRGLGSLSNACIGRDIALIRLSRPSGESFPGAFGFGHYSESFVKGRGSYNRGYPNCGGTGDPDATGGSSSSTSVCRSNTLYGGSGSINDFISSDRVMTSSHDVSPGMSGSAAYLYSSGAKVFGVLSAGPNCYNGCTQSYPNKFARINSTFYGWMLNFMGI